MSLESEGKEMSRLNTHRHTYIHTYRHVNIELEFCETEFAIIIIMIMNGPGPYIINRMWFITLFRHKEGIFSQ